MVAHAGGPSPQPEDHPRHSRMGRTGWIGKGTLYTPAMAHYSAVFLNGAGSQYHLDIPYTGI
jgi:hypothetical protein